MRNTSAAEAYRSALARVGQPVTFQRISGVAPNVTITSATVNANVADYVADSSAVSRTGFSEHKLGAITQGDRRVIVSAVDLEAEGFPLPVKKNDKVIIRGETLNVTDVDPNKRQFASAIELTVTGV